MPSAHQCTLDSDTREPTGIIDADVLQGSFAACRAQKKRRVPQRAPRRVQAQQWAWVATALALNAPRELCLSGVWARILLNALALVLEVTKAMCPHAGPGIDAGTLEASLPDFEAPPKWQPDI
eukprot:6259256-Amphidinium_carterae.1